jgi:hypothetical protein
VINITTVNNSIIEFDTVYESITCYPSNYEKRQVPPSFEVIGAGTVKLYYSNNPVQPVSINAMKAHAVNLVADVYPIGSTIRWIGWQVVTGSPQVAQINLIK